jgi:hypothetical protein
MRRVNYRRPREQGRPLSYLPLSARSHVEQKLLLDQSTTAGMPSPVLQFVNRNGLLLHQPRIVLHHIEAGPT